MTQLALFGQLNKDPARGSKIEREREVCFIFFPVHKSLDSSRVMSNEQVQCSLLIESQPVTVCVFLQN